MHAFFDDLKCSRLQAVAPHAGDFLRRFWPQKYTKKILAAILAAQSELERLEVSFFECSPVSAGQNVLLSPFSDLSLAYNASDHVGLTILLASHRCRSGGGHF